MAVWNYLNKFRLIPCKAMIFHGRRRNIVIEHMLLQYTNCSISAPMK